MSEAQMPPGNVLLVDDDPFILREYGKLLERFGLKVAIAENGKAALEYVQTKSIDVIITDLAMPTMGGLPFLRSLRKIDLEVPVILITGSPNLESAVAAVEYGAFQYLTKPVAPEKLKNVLTRALTFRALDRLHRQAEGDSVNPGLPDRAALEARFEVAVSRLWMAYQPIVTWNKKAPLAYEALVRSAEPTMNNPGALFDAAERLDSTLELGRAIRAKVAVAMEQHPDLCFFINLNPIELNDDALYSSSCPLARYASRIVFEVTERSALTAVSGLGSKIDRLKSRGYRIAVDDLGAGFASLSSFIHIEPDFVKLDMSLVRDVHMSSRKRSLVRGIHQICSRDLNIQVICEGVETVEERDTLLDEGLDLLQGYYFGRPEEQIKPPSFVEQAKVAV